jgi:hypothetical protein
MADEVLDIPFRAGKKVVEAYDIVAVREKSIAQVRSEEPGTACNENGLQLFRVALASIYCL